MFPLQRFLAGPGARVDGGPLTESRLISSPIPFTNFELLGPATSTTGDIADTMLVLNEMTPEKCYSPYKNSSQYGLTRSLVLS